MKPKFYQTSHAHIHTYTVRRRTVREQSSQPLQPRTIRTAQADRERENFPTFYASSELVFIVSATSTVQIVFFSLVRVNYHL